jgi:colanic acid biosynthesis protein WcaH
MTGERPIPPSEYAVIAEHVPVVSVDLLVPTDEGLLFGKRRNEPARSEWFVPGGTVLKGERRREAVERVAEDELGTPAEVHGELGVYDHFYDAAASPGVERKQYLATAYVAALPSDVGVGDIDPDDQHAAFEAFRPPLDGHHRYVRRYATEMREAGYPLGQSIR